MSKRRRIGGVIKEVIEEDIEEKEKECTLQYIQHTKSLNVDPDDNIRFLILTRESGTFNINEMDKYDKCALYSLIPIVGYLSESVCYDISKPGEKRNIDNFKGHLLYCLAIFSDYQHYTREKTNKDFIKIEDEINDIPMLYLEYEYYGEIKNKIKLNKISYGKLMKICKK